MQEHWTNLARRARERPRVLWAGKFAQLAILAVDLELRRLRAANKALGRKLAGKGKP